MIIKQIAAGGFHSLAVTDASFVFTWGFNGNGQLGDGSVTKRLYPVPVSSLTGIIQIAGGYYHSLAIASNGSVYAWGNNGNGQLGDGSTTTSRSYPLPVLFNSPIPIIKQIAAGIYHSLALTSNEIVYAWGNGASTTQSSTPVLLSSLTGIIQIAAGNRHSLALASNGTVYAWGLNDNGQLGDGSTTSRSSPVLLSSLTGITQIAAGQLYSLALASNGTVYAWGSNVFGQLGDGSTTSRSYPLPVLFNSPIPIIKQIAAGGYHSLALASNETVYAWGYNVYYQLGDGSTAASKSSPFPVSSLTGIIQIAAGNYHSLALANNGTVYAWGNNDSGSLGNGTTRYSSIPIPTVFPSLPNAIIQDYSYNNIYILNTSNVNKSSIIPPNVYLIIPRNLSNIVISPGIVIINEGTLINYGTLRISSNAAITNAAGGVIINEFSGTLINDSARAENINYGHFINRGTYRNDLISSTFTNAYGGVFKNKNGGKFDNYGLLTNNAGAEFDNYYNFLRDNSGGQIVNYGEYINDIIYGPGTTFLPPYNIIAAGTSHSLAIDSSTRLWSWGSNTQGQLGNQSSGTSSNIPLAVSTQNIPYKNEILWVSYDVSASAPLSNYIIDISSSVPALSSVYINEFAGYKISDAAASLAPSFPKLSATTSCETQTSRINDIFNISLALDVSNNITATEDDNFTYLLNKIVDISGLQTIHPIKINSTPFLQEIDARQMYQLIIPTDISGASISAGDVGAVIQYIQTHNTKMTFTFSGFTKNDISLNFSLPHYDISNNTNSRLVVNPYNKYISTNATVFDLSVNNGPISVNLFEPNGIGSPIKIAKGNLKYSIPVDLTPNNSTQSELKWIDVVAGGNSSFGLSTDSSNNLYAWGDNTSGHLGINNSTITQLKKPEKIFFANTNTKWIGAASGINHLLALDSNNTLYSCGDNAYGQLGYRNIVTGATIDLAAGAHINLQPASSSSYPVPSDGSLNFGIAGENGGNGGGIGAYVTLNGYNVKKGDIITIKNIPGGNNSNSTFKGGSGYVVSVNNVNIAVAGGGGGKGLDVSNLGGNAGNPSNTSTTSGGNKYNIGESGIATSPEIGAGGGGINVGGGGSGGQISDGNGFDGLAFSSGGNGGNCYTPNILYNRKAGGGGGGFGGGGGGGGNGGGGGAGGSFVLAAGSIAIHNTTNQPLFMTITNTTNITGSNSLLQIATTTHAITQFACGDYHSLAIDVNSDLWTVGDNRRGQLGVGATPDISRNIPTKIQNPNPNAKWIKVAGGTNHSLGLQSDGTLYAWGSNLSGQLGIGSSDSSRNIPTLIPSPSLHWIDIAAGGFASFALSNTNALYSWGAFSNKQLGIASSSSSNQTTPQLITAPPSQFLKVCAGGTQTLGIGKNDRILYAWGINPVGQLGIGNFEDKNLPTDVSNINPLIY